MKFKKLISSSKKKGNIVAALIEKGNLKSKTKKTIKTKKNRLFRFEFIKKLLKILPKKTKIISTTGYTSRELMQLSNKTDNWKNIDKESQKAFEYLIKSLKMEEIFTW